MSPYQDNAGIHSKGFTLIEVMFSIGITLILMIGFYKLLISQNRAYYIEDQVVEMQQNTRAAMNLMMKEIRMAGYQAMGDRLFNDLPSWVDEAYLPVDPMGVNLDANPKITVGPGNEPDMITFLTMLDLVTNPTTLESSVLAGAKELTLSLCPSSTGVQYRKGDLVHLGMTSEWAVVAGISSSTLTLDFDPLIEGIQGVARDLKAGTRIGEISVITYAVFNDDNDPTCDHHKKNYPELKRKVNAGGFQPVASQIIDLEMSPAAPGVVILSMTGRTRFPDADYPKNEGYRNYTVERIIDVRNAGAIGIGSDCQRPAAPGGFSAAGSSFSPCTIGLNWNPVVTDSSSPGEPLEPGCEVTSYKIVYGTSPSLYPYMATYDTESTTALLDVSSLNACTIYLAASGVNSGGEGVRTSGITWKDTASPARPEGLSGLVEGDNQVTLAWNRNLDCDLAGYNLYRAPVIDGSTEVTTSDPVNSDLLSPKITRKTDVFLKGCTTYAYRIKAIDHCSNESEFSDEIKVEITDNTPPLPPSAVWLSADGRTVCWNLSPDEDAKETEVKGYRVYSDGLIIDEVGPGIAFLGLEDGVVAVGVGVSAVDYCGNESEIASLDDCRETPDVRILEPASGDSVSGTGYQVSGTAEAFGGRQIKEVRLRLDDGGWASAEVDLLTMGDRDMVSWTFEFDAETFEEGIHILTAEARDSSGCSASDAVNIQINQLDLENATVACQVYACKPQGNKQVYIRVYLSRTDNDQQEPVSGAHIVSPMVSDPFQDLGGGWYGGGSKSGCCLDSPEAMISDQSFKDDDLPMTIEVTATGSWGEISGSVVIHDEP